MQLWTPKGEKRQGVKRTLSKSIDCGNLLTRLNQASDTVIIPIVFCLYYFK